MRNYRPGLVEDKLFVQSVLMTGWIPAAESWVYASADSPTFTVTIQGDVSDKYWVGTRVKLTQTTVKYFIITALEVAYPSNVTTITLYGGTDYTLANATVSDLFYSYQKAPQGFPLDPAKWTVTVTDTSMRTQATPVQNTWYNLGSVTISIPIGVWNVSYQVQPTLSDATDQTWVLFVTLSTANNSESDSTWTCRLLAGSIVLGTTLFRQQVLSPSVKTSYYLNTKTSSASLDNMYNSNDNSPLILRAVCAYL